MTNSERELTERHFDRLRELIEERVGLHYSGSRRDCLRRALVARMAKCGAADWHDYGRLLAGAQPEHREFDELLRLIAIGETAFFRVPAHFEALRTVLVPAIAAASDRGALNVWSAGCSTGEEPYSVAMTLADTGAALRGWRISILGTDLGAEALDRARSACYSGRAVRGLPRGYLARYFRRRGSGYEVDADTRSSVAFSPCNLASSAYPQPDEGGWDVIFCRNVLMYFRPEIARRVLAQLHQALRPGGFLFLGPAEGLAADSGFDTIAVLGAFIRVRPPVIASLAARQLSTPSPDPAARVVARPIAARKPARARPNQPRAEKPRLASEDEVCAQALIYIAEDRWEKAELALASCAQASSAAGVRRDGRPSPSPRLRVLRAWVWALRGREEQALDECRALVSADPLLASAHYILGIIAVRSGKAEDGIRHFGRAIYIDSEFVPAHYHLGITHCSLGDPVAARRGFTGALRALESARDGWRDFSEGVTVEQWRQVCEERLASLAGCG
jgi:chemotaxis protein methyltransferase CheR